MLRRAITLFSILFSIFLVTENKRIRTFGDFSPDTSACYILRNLNGNILGLPDKGTAEKEVYVVKDWNPSAERAWKFVASSTDSSQPRYKLQKCLSNEYLAWSEDESKQLDIDRHYLFDVIEEVFAHNEWLVVPDEDGKYQILDADSGAHNLYAAQVFMGSFPLAFVWTGTGVDDWAGNEHLKRLWSIEKLEDTTQPPTEITDEPGNENNINLAGEEPSRLWKPKLNQCYLINNRYQGQTLSLNLGKEPVSRIRKNWLKVKFDNTKRSLGKSWKFVEEAENIYMIVNCKTSLYLASERPSNKAGLSFADVFTSSMQNLGDSANIYWRIAPSFNDAGIELHSFINDRSNVVLHAVSNRQNKFERAVRVGVIKSPSDPLKIVTFEEF